MTLTWDLQNLTRRGQRFNHKLLKIKLFYLAEREGFEPPVPFRVQRFSRPPVSTAHTPLRVSVVNSLPAVAYRRSESSLNLFIVEQEREDVWLPRRGVASANG